MSLRLPPATRHVFAIPSVMLTFITVVSVVGALLVAAVMLVDQMRREALKAFYVTQLEERERHLRRLRWRRDDAVVYPPPPADGCAWHFFLSHAWGGGQVAASAPRSASA